MIIHMRAPKSKQKKPNRQKHEQYLAWLKSHAPKPIATKSLGKLKEIPPFRRETPHYPSLNMESGFATKKAPVQYTGDAMLGVATMHKSNSVPVFQQKDAEDISRMRR